MTLKTIKCLIKTIQTVVILILVSPQTSANEITNKVINDAEQPLSNGRDIFAKYGLNDDIPKLGLSSLSQGEHLVEHVKRSEKIGISHSESEVFLIQNTDSEGNIDIRIKYNPMELAKDIDVVSQIEKSTRTQYQLRKYIQSYDPHSVKETIIDDNHVEITFNYSKYGLPQDIAYFRFMRVKIVMKNKRPISMTISNKNPFKFDKYTIDTYQQEVTFNTLTTGKVIIDTKQLEIRGKIKNKEHYELIVITTPVVTYYENQSEVLNADYLKQVSDPRMREVNVKLNSLFPLFGDAVRRKGIDIPKPYGISIAYRNQNMNFGFTDFNVMGKDLNTIFDATGSKATVNAESFTVRGDINILPFWNVYGLAGKIDIDAKIDADYTGELGQGIKDNLNDKLNGLGDLFCKEVSALCSQANVGIPLHLQYDVLGIGTTLSMGYKEYFTSVSATYSKTKLKGTDNWGDGILSIQPMVGYQFADYRTQLFVGAEYQGLKPRFTGKLEGIDINGETFEYDVGVDLNKWAFLVGFNKQIGKNYNVTLLLNKGETRNSATLNIGYRF